MDMYGEGTPKQRVAKFDEMHGGLENAIHDATWNYYADGACREHSTLGALCEPPSDPRERHQKIVYFHKLRVAKAVRAFDTVKAEFREHPNTHTKWEENLEDLKALQEEVQTFQKDLETAQEALRRLTPGYRTPEEEARTIAVNAANAAAKSEYLAAIDSIQI